jgi:hypothetical protein
MAKHGAVHRTKRNAKSYAERIRLGLVYVSKGKLGLKKHRTF